MWVWLTRALESYSHTRTTQVTPHASRSSGVVLVGELFTSLVVEWVEREW